MCDIICQQVLNAQHSGFFSSSTSVDTVTNAMNSNIGELACRAVQKQIDLRHKQKVFWRVISMQEKQPAVGVDKVYSDKSETTLEAHHVMFYSLHVTLAYFAEE